MADRDLDVVLFGATGFTGQLVAEYLARKRAPVRWALAGRSKDKLEQVRAGLAAVDPGAKDLPIIVAESLDPAAMRAIAARARVVCTTVGPYAKYGEPLVAACADAGASYCDLTGETPFIRRMIDAHHARAAATGARVVCCCGFDSIPSDLGVLMLHDHLQKQGDRLVEAHFRLVRASGGMSGGSVASILALFENVRDPAVRRALGDPYALDPEGSPRGGDVRDAMGPGRDADGHWTAPFIMAPVNTRVVRRSNALLDHAYGRDFRYDEAIDTGAGVAGLGRALGVSVAMAAVGAVAAVGPTRNLAKRFLPAPGEGPNAEARARGHFLVEIRGRSAAGERVVGTVAGDLDPGYGQTAVMLGESALCLAEDDLRSPGGLLTPAASMGTALIERLRAAGMTFRVA